MKRLCFALLLCSTSAWALPITVAWDANPPAEGVVAYRVGECQPGTLDCSAVGETAGLTYTVDVALSASKCFRVLALNQFAIPSDWSKEVCVQPTKPSAVNRWRVVLYVPQ